LNEIKLGTKAELKTERNEVVLVKISSNQIRGSKAIKSALCAGLLIFPVAGVVAPQISAPKPMVVTLRQGATSVEIQRALDLLPERGGEVVLPPGIFQVRQPIVLRRDHQTLRGAGETTVLHLADGANCPVIILGEPVNNPRFTVKHLRLSSLAIDGNRRQQQHELWRLRGEGSEIHNNGITVQGVTDSVVEHITSANCRSGGLVTTRHVRRLTVQDYTAFDNEFDGLACYQTEDCLFTGLRLHDNPGAGISLDLAFNHNVISNAVLTANDLGIFMRASRDNRFDNISIRRSHHYGVFMAHTGHQTGRGWQPIPRTECVHNSFNNLIASDCGSAGFRVNDTTCTNNVIVAAQFLGNGQGGLSLARPDLVTVQ
jgi:hypothetical protein